MLRELKLHEDDKYHIRFQLLELMQNANDHAGSEMGFFVCAQSYPSTKALRFCVVDVGRGLPTVLKTIGRYRGRDSELIELASRPGVTTRQKTYGGMGLWAVRKYLRTHKGTLTIISENGKVSFRPRETVFYDEQVRFPGTIIDIHMKA